MRFYLNKFFRFKTQVSMTGRTKGKADGLRNTIERSTINKSRSIGLRNRIPNPI